MDEIEIDTENYYQKVSLPTRAANQFLSSFNSFQPKESSSSNAEATEKLHQAQLQMAEKVQQQYLPYGGYVNIQNGYGSEQFNLFPQVSKKKPQDIIVT